MDPLFALYLLFVATVPLARPALLTLGTQPLQLSDLFLVLTYGLFVWRWLRGRMPIRPDRLLVASIVYLGILALSLVAAGSLDRRHLVKLIAYSTFVFLPSLSTRLVTDEKRLAWVVRAWLCGGALAIAVGLVGIVGFYLDRQGVGASLLCGYGGIPSGNYPRLCAPFRHPNMFASYLSAVVPLWVACGALLLKRPWAAVVVVLGGLVAVFTISAQLGGLAVAGALALVGVLRSSGRRPGLLAPALLVAAAAVAGFLALASVATLVPHGEGHIALGARDLKLMDGMRPSIWRGIVPNLRAHPLTGLGYGSLVSLTDDPRAFTAADKVDLVQGQVKPTWLEGHNVWLSVAGQAGVIGLLGFVWLLFEIARGWLSTRWPRTGQLAALPYALAGAFFGVILYGGEFAAIEEARHVWALLGLLAAWLALGRQERVHTVPG